MQRDFNNNFNNLSDIYNSQNATNLTVSLLPTKTDVATSITTAINNNNTNYTSNLLLGTLINNNIVANNLLYTNTTNLNILLANAVTSRDLAISTASSSCNTYSTAYTNTKISTEVSDRNTAITNNNAINLALIKSYSVDQNFTNINLTGKINFTILGDTSTNYGFNSFAGSQCIAIGVNANNILQMNSLCIDFSSRNLAGGSISIGSYALTYSNCIAIGYNSANQSNSQNTNNTYLGYNANIPLNSSYSNSTAIGYNSIINNSNTIQLGRDLLDTTNCYALTTTNLTATNITNTNLTATTATINNLSLNSTTTFNYTTLPTFSSFKNQGFSSTSSNLKNIYAYDTIYNCNSITLPCGVYFINYKFELNYNVTQTTYWLNFGLGSTALLIDLQQNKNYCSSAGNINSTYLCSNSYCFVRTNGSVIYQNVMMNAFDNTISVVNLAQFIISAKMTAIRIA